MREGQVFLERALARHEGAATPLQARALYAAAFLASGLDDMERIETLCGECLSLYRELGDTSGIASSLALLGSRAAVRGHYALACSRLEEAEVLFQLGELPRKAERSDGQCVGALSGACGTRFNTSRPRGRVGPTPPNSPTESFTTLLANESYGAIGHGTRKGCHYHDTIASTYQAVSW